MRSSSSPSSQSNSHLILEVTPTVKSRLEPLFAWREKRKTASLAAGNDGYLRDRVVFRHERANQCMAGLCKFMSESSSDLKPASDKDYTNSLFIYHDRQLIFSSPLRPQRSSSPARQLSSPEHQRFRLCLSP